MFLFGYFLHPSRAAPSLCLPIIDGPLQSAIYIMMHSINPLFILYYFSILALVESSSCGGDVAMTAFLCVLREDCEKLGQEKGAVRPWKRTPSKQWMPLFLSHLASLDAHDQASPWAGHEPGGRPHSARAHSYTRCLNRTHTLLPSPSILL